MDLNLSAIAVLERAITLFFILLVAAGAFVKLGRAEGPSITIKNLTIAAILLALGPDGRGVTVVGDDAHSIRAADVRNVLDSPRNFSRKRR